MNTNEQNLLSHSINPVFACTMQRIKVIQTFLCLMTTHSGILV